MLHEARMPFYVAAAVSGTRYDSPRALNHVGVGRQLLFLTGWLNIGWDVKCWMGCVYPKASSANHPGKSTNVTTGQFISSRQFE